MTAVVELTRVLDGRWLRSVRTRGAIVDAWLELIAEGDLAPTAKGVAQRAGIGLRTVFQHFSEMNSLHAVAAHEFMTQLSPSSLDITPDLPVGARIERICHHRSLLFENSTLVRRACERQEWIAADVHEIIHHWEQLCANDVLRVFAPELDSMEYDICCVRGIGVSAVLSWSTWNQLRERRHLSVVQSRMVLVDAITTLVA